MKSFFSIHPAIGHVLWTAIILFSLVLSSSSLRADFQNNKDAVEKELPNALAKSRKVLLGDRKLPGKSCIVPVAAGELEKVSQKMARQACSNGGCGTKYVDFYMNRKVTSPLEEFKWHQNDLKDFLSKMLKANNEAGDGIKRIQTQIDAILKELNSSMEAPDNVAAAKPPSGGSWIEYCWAQFKSALAAGNLNESRRWFSEFKSAIFAVSDLHLWLGFLIENQLMAISFQSGSEQLFHTLDESYRGKYRPETHVARFPAGNWTIYGADNYLEVERQAETLFQIQDEDRRAALDDKWNEAPSSLSMPPHLRGTFLKLRNSLKPRSRELWDRAANSSFERSFMANILWRAQTVGFVESLATVLERFDAKFGDNRNVDVNELMDVLPYRGAYFAGMEWADRFNPRLMKMSAAKSFSGSNRDVLKAAYKAVNSIYDSKKNYAGLVLTIRATLDTNKMDCIRATDFVGALYRDSGQPGFRKVRLLRGGSGHTVPAAESQNRGGEKKIIIMDPLVKGESADGLWPNKYLNDKETYCMELYGRGIDSWIFLEGFIRTGPNAGMLCRVAVPYLPGYEQPRQTKLKNASDKKR